MTKVVLLLLTVLLAAPADLAAGEPSLAEAQREVRRAFKRLDLERVKNLDRTLRPRLPAGIVTEPGPFEALVADLLEPHREQVAARPPALRALAAFPAAKAGAAVESSLRALDKEAGELEKRIAEVEEAYAEVFDRGYMGSSEQVRGTRKLAAVLIPFYRRLLALNREATAAAAAALAAWAEGEDFAWVASRATGAGDARLRVAAARALASVRTEAARELLETIRGSDEEAAVRTEALASLLAWPLGEVQGALVAALGDDAWQVRALAIEACRRGGLLGAVLPLIQALRREEGRLRTDIDEALHALVGVRLYGDVARWDAWWEQNGDDVLARAADPAEGDGLARPLGAPETWPPEEGRDAGERERRGGTSSFYGIETESRRVLFVVDISFSMDQAASTPAGGGAPHGSAHGRSKLDVAREQLASALEGLPDDADVDIVVYSESYATWQGEVGRLGKHRKKAAAFLQALCANGTTNIADALDKAFAMAGDRATGDGGELVVDTIFLLSDGDPNRGRITDLGALLADVVARNARTRFVVHTVGIGEAAGSSFLKALAGRTGGRYVEFR